MLIEYTKNGRRVNAHRQVAKVLIAKGLARAVEGDAITAKPEPAQAPSAASVQTYSTRMLQADKSEAAPYGYKADGTPRKRPAPPPRTSTSD